MSAARNLRSAQVVRWAWVSPVEFEAGILPSGIWWTDAKPPADSLKKHLYGERHWVRDWKIALRLLNGQIVYVSQKAAN